MLNIENASVGVDANNVEAALRNLNTQVIQAAIDKMNSSMKELRDYVDAAWVGKSAEIFKGNMESDKGVISKALTDSYDSLRSEMYQIVNAMTTADEQLISRRGA